MTKRTTGRYERTTVGGEEVAAFIPHPLPPARPPVVLDATLTERIRVAEQELVRLELAGEMVPSLDWFVYAFVRKEAVLSSQIEGTQATLVDLLTFEAQEGGEQGAPPSADIEEVCNSSGPRTSSGTRATGLENRQAHRRANRQRNQAVAR
jgi:hypothetical protein